MNPIDTITKSLESYLPFGWQYLYPPTENIFGDLSSDIAYRLAQLYNCDPKKKAFELAIDIQSQFLPSEGVSVEAQNGYLNFLLSSSSLYPLDYVAAHQVIIIPPPVGLCVDFSYLRLCAAGLQHAALRKRVGFETTIVLGGAQRVEVCDETDLLYLFKQLFKDIIGSSYQNDVNVAQFTLDTLLSFSEPSSSVVQEFVLWADGPIWSKSELLKFENTISPQKLNFCFPEREWLYPIHHVDTQQVDQKSSVYQENLFYYLLSDLQADELDLYAPALQEKRNIHWYFERTVCRLQEARVGSQIESALDKELAILSHFQSVAAANGQVIRYYQLFVQLIDRVNRVLNERRGFSAAFVSALELLVRPSLKPFESPA